MSGCYLRSQLLYRGKHLVVKLDDIYFIDVHILVLNQIIAILCRCTCDCAAVYTTLENNTFCKGTCLCFIKQHVEQTITKQHILQRRLFCQTVYPTNPHSI